MTPLTKDEGRVMEREALLALAEKCNAKAHVELSFALMPTVAASTIRERALAASALFACADVLRSRANQVTPA